MRENFYINDDPDTAAKKLSEDDGWSIIRKQIDEERRATNIDPSNDLDPLIPDRDYAEYYINIVKKTVRKEDGFVRQVFYVVLSKDSDDPLNLAVLATTGEGKTYGILQTLQYFPDDDIWYIGSMSPKVIVRQRGILVDSEYNPLKPKLLELKKEIRRCQQNGDLDKEEQHKAELDEFKQDAKVLIDLKGQCLVFLEPPHTETWNILKATLSHDRYEIEHPYVYEVPGLGFTVKKIVTRGWPSCIFASARNESKWAIWPEIQSRFHVISPNMVPEKVREGNILISQKMSLPDRLQNKIIVSPQEKELARKCARYLMQHVKNTMTQEPDKQANPFLIPYGLVLGEALPSEKGTDNRLTKRIFSFLRMITLSRSHLRCSLQYGDERLIISSIADLHEALHIMQNLSGIPNYKLSMYKEYYLQCYRSKYDRKNGEPDQSSDGKRQEIVLGLSNKEFCDYYKNETGKTLSTRAFRETYIEEWYNNGLIEEIDSIIDSRQKIHYPIVLVSSESESESIFESKTRESVESKTKEKAEINSKDVGEQQFPKIKQMGVSIQSPSFLQPRPIIVQKNFKEIPKNWLELHFFELLKWEFQEGNEPDLSSSFEQLYQLYEHNRSAIYGRFQIYDEDSSKICFCKFYDKYSQTWSLRSYFSKDISCEKLEKHNGPLKYQDRHKLEKCKIMGDWLQTPNCSNSDGQPLQPSHVCIDAVEGNKDRNKRSQIAKSESDLGLSKLMRCYNCDKVGKNFETFDETEYKKHGAQNHHKNPLLYPSKAEIKKYGLKPQGKSWEI